MTGSASRGGRAAQPDTARIRSSWPSMQTAPTWDRPRSRPARGSRRSRACTCCCSARPSSSATSGPGVEVVDAPVSVAKSPDPVRAVRSTPEASIVQAAKSGGRGSCRCACVRGRYRSGARGRPVQRQARARHPSSGARSADTGPRPIAVTLLDVGASAQARPRAPGPVCLHGSGFRERRARRRAPSRRSALKRRGVRARQRAGRAERARSSRNAPATGSCASSATSRAATSSMQWPT